MSWEPAETLGNAQQLVDEFHCSHPGKPRYWRKGINLSFYLSFFLIGCAPVQMASAHILPPFDHSQVEVAFPRAPDPQDDGGIVSCLFVRTFLVYGDAAQEVCG
jgi:hypothetical protein